MCKLIENNADYISAYCQSHNLSSEKVFTSPVCFNERLAFVQYVEQDAPAIMDKNPAKVILIISKTDDGVLIEQTEHTQRYLSIT